MGIPIERPLHIVSSPENSITKTVSIDTNILDLYLSSGYDPDDFSVTHLDGVDVGVLETAALTIDEAGKTISGLIKLNQRLDFENPIDRGENATDNDYEVALFRVMSKTSSNDFKLIIRITNLEAETRKLEILVDSLHLDDINQQRGIREIYLYEDKEVMDPLMGNDPNNFLSDNLVERTSVMGNVDAMASTMNLYDNDDTTSGFLTATPVNNSGNTYHRLIINFTKEVNIEKVAIRGRQVGGYYGFVFILRDKNDHIVYVHQASTPLSRGSGSDVDATSTYAFVPDYNGFTTITDFNINLDNTFFDIAENTTNVLLIDNFSVAVGYEYERGEVSINPGADFAKFNTDNLVFIDNELRGLSFKVAPDAENRQDTDRNNVYEVGTVTISNFDGGKTNFSLPVRVVNVPSIVSLLSNEVRLVMGYNDSTIISNLTAFVDPNTLTNAISLGDATYVYEIRGDDAIHFKIVGNTLKSANDSGLRSINTGAFNDLRVVYIAEGGVESDAVNIKIRVEGWHKLNATFTPPYGDGAASALLNNVFYHFDRTWTWHINGGIRQGSIIHWHGTPHENELTSVSEAVVLNNDEALLFNQLGHIWSSENLRSVGNIGWGIRQGFKAVVLTNNDVLLIGGLSSLKGNYLSHHRNDVWRSSDGGTNWSVITSQAPWQSRYAHQAVVLTNNDILVMGGTHWIYNINDIWRSSDGGTNWSRVITSHQWSPRGNFRAVVFENNDILVMGGLGNGALNDVYISKNGGINWENITPTTGHWTPRYKFQAVVLPDDGFKTVLIHGGYGAYGAGFIANDTWIGRIR